MHYFLCNMVYGTAEENVVITYMYKYQWTNCSQFVNYSENSRI